MRLDLPHILIVDDDKRILQLINDYLIKNNFGIMSDDLLAGIFTAIIIAIPMIILS